MEKLALPTFPGDFSLGFYGIQVQPPEVEEEVHLEPLAVAKASGLGDNELNETVEPLGTSVVVEMAAVGDDALQMGSHHARHAAHGIQSAPERPGDPLPQE